MNKKLFSFLRSGLLAFTIGSILLSCTQNDLEQNPIVPAVANKNVSLTSTLSHSISMDSIKSIALSIPNQFNNKQTKSIQKAIKEILPLSHFVNKAPVTKSNNEDSDCIYIVNYESDQGFCIISKDTRIPTLLGYSDNGNIAPGKIHNGLAYTLNAIPIYVNQKMEEYQQMLDSLNQNLDLSSWFIQTKAFGDCRYDSLSIEVDGTDYDIENPAYNRVLEIHDYGEGDWNLEEKKDPLFNNINWHQSYPYNTKIPAVAGCDNALVGCVAIAVGQILAYNQYPNSFVAKNQNYTVNYNNILTYTNDCALFLRGVADAVEMKYDCLGSGSNIYKANNALKNIFHYKTDGATSYNWKYVVEDLSNNQLVYTRGETNNDEGHAWIIDGYISRNRLTHSVAIIYNDQMNCVVGSRCIEEFYKTQNLVHCNWGWANNGDGYFESGIFTPSHPVIGDDIYRPSNDYNFFKSQMIIKNVRK